VPPPLSRTVLGPAAIFAALAVLGGCGGGNGGTLTKAEFVARGDEICKQAHEQFSEAQQNPPNTPAGAAELQRRLIEVSEGELSAIDDLDAPSDIRPALDRYLRARERGIALLKRGLAAARQEDERAYAAAQARLAAGQVRRLRLARAVGFRECSVVANPSSPGGG
jgi:hypothetical protein